MSTKVKSISVDGASVAYRAAAKVAVADGKVVRVKVVAPDGVTTSEYSFKLALK